VFVVLSIKGDRLSIDYLSHYVTIKLSIDYLSIWGISFYANTRLDLCLIMMNAIF
jgi:hypothetical protein